MLYMNVAQTTQCSLHIDSRFKLHYLCFTEVLSGDIIVEDLLKLPAHAVRGCFAGALDTRMHARN